MGYRSKECVFKIAGYAVENTLSKEIMNQPKEVVTMEGRIQPLSCLVDYVSFSAHVDFMQNRNFIQKVDPKHIILVHGQKDEMGRLMSALMLQYNHMPKEKRPTITMPPNLQEVKLKFARRRSAKVMGSLADREKEPREGESVSGILVTQNFNSKIVSPEDLPTYTQLRVGSVSSRLHVPFVGQVSTLRLFLNEMFTGVIETENEEEKGHDGNAIVTFSFHEDQVKVTTGKTRGIATVEWEASPLGDVLADSVVALLMHAQSSAASIRLTSQPCGHQRKVSSSSEENEDGDQPPSKKLREEKSQSTTESRLRLIHNTLLEQFKNVEATYESRVGTFEIKTDAGLESGSLADDDVLICNVRVEFEDDMGIDSKITVECNDGKLATNIQDCIQNVATAAAPIKI
mmetsp:Transcript_28920/g.43620  ORF Transcript_28920/g.43620 Transcript_28920/m.43620 type:complete len:402 (+) Transcript_28920:704-1909(+)